MIRPKDIATAFDLPPEKAVAYLQQKGYQITWDWREMLDRAHRQAFTVAKAMQADVLQDIRNSVQSALDNGDSLGTFKKKLKPLLESKGWWGKVEQTNPATGKTQKVQTGSPFRLETIYRTNLQSAYQAGRLQEQQTAAKERPYWQYLSVSDNRSRPSHATLNGMVLPADHAFWSTNYPPNGFRCRCRVTTYTKKGLDRAGLAVQANQVNFTPDKGFAAAPTELRQPDIKKYDTAIGRQLQLAFDGEITRRPIPPPKPTAKPGEQEYTHFADAFTGLGALRQKEQSVVVDSINNLSRLLKAKRTVTLVPEYEDLAPSARRDPGTVGGMVPTRIDGRLWIGRDLRGVDRTPAEMRATFYHEYGHILDIGAQDAIIGQGTNPNFKSRVNYEEMSRIFNLTEAAKNTAVYDLRYRKYIHYPHEIFARGFAQYIAEKADPASLKTLLNDFSISTGVQWSTKDFAPVRTFIEQELERLELSVN